MNQSDPDPATPPLPPTPAQPAPSTLQDTLLDGDMAELARRNPGRFWLVAACCAALVLMGLSAWRQGWFTPTVHVYVELPGAVGVQVGTLVKLKGFKIGEVDNVNLEPNLSVLVRMRIVQERLALLGMDSSARFGRDGPLGGKFIDILPGSRDLKRLEADATLPIDSGNELEDVMATVKIAVEKLASAIAKVEPILDDTKTLTGEATAMRKDIRSSITTVLANMDAMSGQMRRVGDAAATVAGKLDADRAALMGDVRKVLLQADQATASARAALQTLEKDLPAVTDKTKTTLDNAVQATDNVRQIIQEARQDIPAVVRAARAATQDAAEITDGVKRAWPVKNLIAPPVDGNLPLDGGENRRAPAAGAVK